MAVHWGGVVSIIIFYLMILAVGLWAARKSKGSKDPEEVMLAGRNIGMVVGIFTMTGKACLFCLQWRHHRGHFYQNIFLPPSFAPKIISNVLKLAQIWQFQYKNVKFLCIYTFLLSLKFCLAPPIGPNFVAGTATAFVIHCQFPYVVTMPWQGSDDVVTILSPTSDTSCWLQNCVSVPLWFLHSDSIGFLVATHQWPYSYPLDAFRSQISTWPPPHGNGYPVPCVWYRLFSYCIDYRQSGRVTEFADPNTQQLNMVVAMRVYSISVGRTLH